MTENQANPQNGPDINRRYQLLAQIGAGGMGIVFQAHDRLTDETVAVKRLILESESDLTTSAHSGVDLRLLMAREFQSLASLRHPNIISVRDYGFDAQKIPYFTMEYLAHAQTILQTGVPQSDGAKVDLLLQILRALAYLHRHGIIHRDLKPSNVLVSNGQVKLLDFGLSTIAGEDGGVSGTLIYLAPEVLEDAPASIAADLYALGIMAYELFSGQHPFNTKNASLLLDSILFDTPDFDVPDIPSGIVPVLARLLAKDPAERFVSAEATIRALGEATGKSLPPETQEIRESFLQAAQFVGREAELDRFTTALSDANKNKGSAWLVGGESGVGKSRFLNEVRTRALVRGFLVMRGQAVSEGGSPYQLWRGIVRWLVVLTNPDTLQAGVLKPLVPDIEQLLDQTVPDAPDLEPEAAQNRLITVVIELIRHAAAEYPLVILLEDLQWARDNSLMMLRQLGHIVPGISLMIISTYRNDEQPELADSLPGMESIELDRLSGTAIAILSESILGEAGRQPQIVEFLEQETEGNTFFIVEVVRALAEEAGQLGKIGQMSLPQQVFAGGMRQIIERRLNRVPARSRPLLQLAAVSGREIDLAVMVAALSDQAVEQWLTDCANAAVLNIQDERWQFSHDKVRQGVLVTLTPDQRIAYHQQIGEAIEQAHKASIASHAVDLAYHYGQAGNPERERHFSGLAGEQAAIQFANEEAIAYFSRALELTPDEAQSERFRLVLAREKVYELLGKRDIQQEALGILEQLAEALNDDTKRAEVALRQSNYAEATSNYPTATATAQEAIKLAEAVGDLNKEAQGYLYWGLALWRQGSYDAAKTQLEQALALAEDMSLLKALSLRTLGLVAWNQGDFGPARERFEQALLTSRKIGDQQVEGNVLNNLGIISAQVGDYVKARDYFEQSLQICRQIGNRQVEGNVLNNLGIVAGYQGDYYRAVDYYEQALPIKREINDRQGQAMVLDNLGDVARYQGNYSQAKRYFEQSLEIRQEIGDRQGQGNVLNNLGTIADYQGDYNSARGYYAQSLNIRREIGDRQGECEGLAYQSLLSHHQGDDQFARTYGELAVEIAQDLEDHHLLGCALTNLGHALVGLDELQKAIDAYKKTLALQRELGENNRSMEPLAGLARVCLSQGDPGRAQDYVDEIISHLEDNTLDGTEEPFRVYLTCFQVLRINRDPRSWDILEISVDLLQARAGQITDQQMRDSFLTNVASHRELMEIWVSVAGDG